MSALFDQNDRGRVRARSFFWPIFAGLAVSLFVICVGFAIAGYFGADVVNVNRRYVHGTTALVAGSIVAVVSALIAAPSLAAVACLGLWIISWFRPLTIRIVRLDRQPLDPDFPHKPTFPTEA